MVGPLLAGVGALGVVVSAILTTSFARRRWGDHAEEAYRVLGRSATTARAVGVPAMVSVFMLRNLFRLGYGDELKDEQRLSGVPRR